MGLDILDLVFQIEKRFSIRLKPETFSQFETVGELHAYLLGRVEEQRELTANSPCPSAHVFYELRPVIAEVAGVNEERVRPDTPLSILPRHRRWTAWLKIRQAVGCHLPDLRKARWRRWLGWASLACVLALPVVWTVATTSWAGIPFGLAVGLIFVLLLYVLIGDLGLHPPCEMPSVKELAIQVVNDRGRLFWGHITELIERVTGEDRNSIKPEQTWADLGF